MTAETDTKIANLSMPVSSITIAVIIIALWIIPVLPELHSYSYNINQVAARRAAVAYQAYRGHREHHIWCDSTGSLYRYKFRAAASTTVYA